MPNQVDIAMTPWRIKVKKLQIEQGTGASPGCFKCRYFDRHSPSCYASLSNSYCRNNINKGDWTYVGYQYGKASINTKKAKILFLSMDRGGQGCGYEEFVDAKKAFRLGAYKRSNSHMGGVAVLLKYLLDNETSCKDRSQQFALTNSVRCRPRASDMDSRSTDQMVLNCENHTKAIIDVLRPDIIIAQGKDKGKENPCKSLLRLFNPNIEKEYDNGRSRQSFRSAEIRRDQGRLFLLTAHPRSYPNFRWSAGYLPDELERLCEHVRELYSECSS